MAENPVTGQQGWNQFWVVVKQAHMLGLWECRVRNLGGNYTQNPQRFQCPEVMVDSTQVWATCPLGAVYFNFPTNLSGPNYSG